MHVEREGGKLFDPSGPFYFQLEDLIGSLLRWHMRAQPTTGSMKIVMKKENY
jgi:hypothetical protein